METIRLNVVLQPPKEIVEEAIKLSRELSKEGNSLYVLDGKNFFPHITLYSPEYPAKNKKKIISALEHLVHNIKPIVVKPKHLEGDGNEGYVLVRFDKTKELIFLHESIVRILNPLREGVIKKETKHLSSEQELSLKNYGHTRVMSLYSAHMSLIRFEDNIVAKKAASHKFSMPSFTASEIAVYEMGSNGTCTKLVRKFPLNFS